jgi:hypothetical protein
MKDFNHTLDNYIKELEYSDFSSLYTKPSPSSWSLGQLYMHIIEATHHYLEEANNCLSTEENSGEEMSPNGKTIFINNEFPDELIEGPESNNDTPQPKSKEELMQKLFALREKINQTQQLISKNSSQGKTKHPGLDYFNAREWFQFAEMHLRHHERQKKRIKDFLSTNK